jgi:hypothetical protein
MTANAEPCGERVDIRNAVDSGDWLGTFGEFNEPRDFTVSDFVL